MCISLLSCTFLTIVHYQTSAGHLYSVNVQEYKKKYILYFLKTLYTNKQSKINIKPFN